MRTLIRFTSYLLLMTLVLVAPYQATYAQVDLCPSYTSRVVSDVASHCASMGPDEVCNGNSNVQTLVDGNSDPLDDSTELGTTSWLAGTLIVDTSPLDLNEQIYGVAPMRVRANLPVGHPGRDLVLMPIGGVEIGNGVPFDEALLLPTEEESLSVVTATTATLYAEASASSPVVGTVPAGTSLIADGTTPDQDWLRVYFEYPGDYGTVATAWINQSVLRNVNTDLLPFVAADSLTPMQKFYFNNTFESPLCPGAPSGSILVQAPKDVETDLVVNDADVLITSSVSFNIREPNTMELRVLDGMAVLCRNTPNEIIVPEGFAIDLPLNLPKDVEIADRLFSSSDFCAWQNLRLMTIAELGNLTLLEQLRTNVLNQSVTLPNIICPSAVGPSACVVTIDDQVTRDSIRELCDNGSISEQVCELVR
ncbi:MAG: hypothetical protein KC547_00360 [Anaerolineae bacterium]|nr:hypothetical protein [Anaerolineae bacterium]